jgi:hypothetical protein
VRKHTIYQKYYTQSKSQEDYSQVFRSTVEAICETIGQQTAAAGDPLLGAPYGDLSAFVLGCFDSMPRILVLGLKGFTLLFAVSGVFHGGRLFSRNPGDARARHWRRWRSHRLSPMRDLVRFYESLATLVLYSRGETAARG